MNREISKRYGSALFFVLVACAINIALHRFLPGNYFSLYLVAIIFSALYGGSGAGIFATLLSIFKIVVFAAEPSVFVAGKAADSVRIQLALFVILSFMVTAMSERLFKSYRLAESRRLEFMELVNALNDAVVWEADAETLKYSFVSLGSERLLHFNRDDWMKEPGFLLHRTLPEDQPSLEKALQKARDGPGDQFCDHRIYNKEGNPIWFHTAIHLNRREGNSRLRGLTVNVSQLKDTEEELMNAIGSREDVLAIVSHDLRQPISSMMLATNLLNTQKENKLVLKVSNQLETALLRMNRLIENLLNLTKMEAGSFALKREALNCSEIMRESVDLLQTLAAEKSISVQTLIGNKEQNLFCFCDHDQIIRVFSNLLGNAVKFTPKGGWIRLGVVQVRPSLVRFSIQDSGPGIRKDQIHHLFERYWQAKKNAFQGTGLGLSIARGIIEAHGGKIWAESKQDQGTTFYFLIPLLKSKDLAA